jgi:hypothetical protein
VNIPDAVRGKYQRDSVVMAELSEVFANFVYLFSPLRNEELCYFQIPVELQLGGGGLSAESHSLQLPL